MSATDLARGQALYGVQLARGRSHIGSTLTSATLLSAIEEVFRDFFEQHGAADLEVFRELLARQLEKHCQAPAAGAVRQTPMTPQVLPPSLSRGSHDLLRR